jgi:hypothetical protein
MIFQVEIYDPKKERGFAFLKASEPAGNQSDFDRWLESDKIQEELYEALHYHLEKFEIDSEGYEITHYEPI